MMMNNQQIGIQDQGFISLSNFIFEMPDSKGFSSQQPVLLDMEGGGTSQSLKTAALSDISVNHFGSGSQGCLNFPRFEQHDQDFPSWSQASEMDSSVYSNHRSLEVADSAEKNYVAFQSRDTLKSLVESSSSCSNKNTQQTYEENIRYQICNVPEDKHVVFQQNQPPPNNVGDRRQHPNISFQKNIQVGNISFKPSSFRLENEATIDYTQGLISTISSTNTSEREAMAKRNRIRWTQELHNQFIECVNRLGGPKKATPKGILKLMNCDGLTILHIKSHLQKYRVAQYVPESKEEKTCRSSSPELDPEMSMQLVKALKMQIDVQQRLYEQLECQKNLQSRIEEQARQLKKMFEHQLESNTKPTKEDAN